MPINEAKPDYRGRRISVEQFEALPHVEARSELVQGRVVREPLAGASHAWATRRIWLLLDGHVEAAGLGTVWPPETGFVLSDATGVVRGPDVAFTATGRVPAGELPTGFLRVVPDLAVEIVADGSERRRLRAKVEDYLAVGVRLVWVLSVPARSVTVHRPGGAPVLLTLHQMLDGDEVVPGFRVAVPDLFGPYG